MSENKEPDRILRPTDPDKLAFFKALVNVEGLEEMPETEEEILEWERTNPDKANRISRALDHVIDEYSMSIERSAEADESESSS